MVVVSQHSKIDVLRRRLFLEHLKRYTIFCTSRIDLFWLLNKLRIFMLFSYICIHIRCGTFTPYLIKPTQTTTGFSLFSSDYIIKDSWELIQNRQSTSYLNNSLKPTSQWF